MIYIVLDSHPFVHFLSKDSYENSLNALQGLSQQEVHVGLDPVSQQQRRREGNGETRWGLYVKQTAWSIHRGTAQGSEEREGET